MIKEEKKVEIQKIHTPFKETAPDPTIPICLSCTAKRCRGWCDKIRRFKKTNE